MQNQLEGSLNQEFIFTAEQNGKKGKEWNE